MPTAQVIGVDLGGMAIKLARIRADGMVLAEAQWPTPVSYTHLTLPTKA